MADLAVSEGNMLAVPYSEACRTGSSCRRSAWLRAWRCLNLRAACCTVVSWAPLRLRFSCRRGSLDHDLCERSKQPHNSDVHPLSADRSTMQVVVDTLAGEWREAQPPL